MPKQTAGPSEPYVFAVDAIGDAWTFLITREAFFGAKRFEEFCDGLSISRARLSERLKHLIDTGILYKREYSEAPVRYEYGLTEKGLAIYQIALSMIDWAERWREPKPSARLIHKPCGSPLSTRTVCRSCGETIRHEDLKWPPLEGLSSSSRTGSNVRGWRKMANFDGISDRSDPAIETLKAVGDRWSMLIMFGAQQTSFGVREAQSKIGVAPNILTDRLKSLVQKGLLTRADGSRQAPYLATQAGRDFLANILITRTWAIDWIERPTAGWAEITHKNCGKPLLAHCVCEHCHLPAHARDVEFQLPKN